MAICESTLPQRVAGPPDQRALFPCRNESIIHLLPCSTGQHLTTGGMVGVHMSHVGTRKTALNAHSVHIKCITHVL